MTDYEALLEEAKTRIARLPNNTYFVLKDLFLACVGNKYRVENAVILADILNMP